MKFKEHPIIKNLTINENGTVIKHFNATLSIKSYTLQSGCFVYKVNFINATHNVAKLVLEAWEGMRDNMDDHIKRHDYDCKSKNYNHYTNLFWGARGGSSGKHSTGSRLSDVNVKAVQKRLKKGGSRNTLKAIAKDYGTSDMSISRIKKSMENDK